MFIPRVATTAEARLQPEFDHKNAEDRAGLAVSAQDEAYLLEDFVDHDWTAEHETDWSQFGY